MQIDQETSIYGLIGFPLGHSLSPLMHNPAFEHAGINAVYLPFPVRPRRISGLVSAAKTLNIKGFNVTIPFKEAIIPYLDRISPEALLCGSVNTVVIQEDQAVGYCTDGVGFLDSLAEEGLGLPRLAVILGAGGAARAIGFSLAAAGSATVFLNRTPERACRLAREVTRTTGRESRGISWEDAGRHEFMQAADLLVNTTPLGMHPAIAESPPVDWRGLSAGAAVCDIIYNPLTTRLLREARNLGFKTINGLGMFVRQGARSWELFTGQEAPLPVMENHLRSYLEEHEK